MKKAILLFLLLPMIASAQYFDVFDIDTSEYPLMKAKFYSIDANGKQILNHTPTDFEITENGEPRDVISVSCPPQKEEPFSVVIAVDVSGSMDNSDLIKIQLKSFIKNVPINGSEVAIIAFNQKNYIVSDFTSNKTKLETRIDGLKIGGGTSFDAALVSPIASALLVMDKAKFKNKAVILLTDGVANDGLNTITSKANSQGTKIYPFVTINRTSNYLNQLAHETNGEIFYRVDDLDKFNNMIVRTGLIAPACTITWKVEKNCHLYRNYIVHYKRLNLKFKFAFNFNDSQRTFLEIVPKYFNFGDVQIGNRIDTNISITANNSDIEINRATFNPNSQNIEILTPLPLRIDENETKDILIRYFAVDSNRTTINIQLNTNLCDYNVHLITGNYDFPVSEKTLELIEPNGGEIYNAGIDSLIKWKGVFEDEEVELYFSSDSGVNWNLIDDKATNYERVWNVPIVESDKCLIRVDNFEKESPKENSLDWSKTYGGSQFDIPSDIKQTKDLGYIIVGYSKSDDGDININNAETDAFIMKLNIEGDIEWVNSFGYDFDDFAYSVEQTIDGGYIVAGKSESKDGDYDIWVTKFDENGAINWSRTYGGSISENAHDIIQVEDYGYIITGLSNPANGGGVVKYGKSDAFVLKIDDKGILQWENYYGGSRDDSSNEIVLMGNGDLVLSGTSNSIDFDIESNVSEEKVWIYRIDKNGSLIWSKTYESISFNQTYSFTKTFDNGFILTGFNGYNPMIVKLHNDGVIEWYKVFEEKGVLHSITQCLNGDYITAGSIEFDGIDPNNHYGKYDSWTMKLSGLGEVLWSKRIGGTVNDETFKVIQNSNRSYILLGYAGSNDGDLTENKGQSDVWIYKINGPTSTPLQSDTSDAVFSIIMPEPVIHNNDIDMGEMIVGSTKDTIVSSVICNTGDAPLHVLGVDITGGDAGDFLIPRGAGDFYLEKDSCQDMMFEFTPSALGNRTAVATIRTTIGDFTDTINIRGVGINPVIEATAEVVNFGVFELGNGKDTTVVLVKNVGSTDINITDTRISGPDMEQFTLNTVPISYTIPAGEEKEFQLNYTAKYGGKSNTFLDFHYDGIGSPIRSLLFAEGIGGEVYPVVADAFVGEAVELGIFLGKIKPEGLSEIATNFTATVSYNSTLLAPIDKSIQVTTEDNKSYINIEGQLSEMNQIAAVPMKVGLGTAVKSGLVITEFQLYDANGDTVDYDIEPGVGEFNVLGICEEGGLRLINPNGEAVNMVVTTDGLNSNARINLTLIETGQTDLVIFDQIGNKIETVYSGTPITGQQEIDLDLSNFSNGRYYIKLTTPTITKTKIIEVVR